MTYGDKLIASLGFNLRSETIKIIQIQGRRGNKKRLKNLKWTHALVDYFCKWAFDNIVPSIGKWDKKGIEGVVEMISGNLSKIFMHPDKDGNIGGMLSYWHESIDYRSSEYIYFFGISEQRKGTSLSRNLVLEFLKEMRSQGIIKIRAGIYSYNQSMRKVVERLGFEQIGTYKEIYRKDNKDLLVYQTYLPLLLKIP